MPVRLSPFKVVVLIVLLPICIGCGKPAADQHIVEDDTQRAEPRVEANGPARMDGTGETEGLHRQPESCVSEQPEARPGYQVITAYFNCPERQTGGLQPAYRLVPDTVAALQAAVEALLAGPTDRERAAGFDSYFSEETDGLLRRTTWSPDRDTVTLDFRDFRSTLPDDPAVRSFLPPGVPAELTWTIFKAEPSVEAVRFAFEGSETAFWKWLGSDAPEVFTRRDWEQV